MKGEFFLMANINQLINSFSLTKEDISFLTNQQVVDAFNKYYEPISNQIVPKSGKAETLAGEIFRAINNIIYHASNDGDIIGNMQNTHNVESAAAAIFTIIQRNLSEGEAKSLALFDIDFKDLHYFTLQATTKEKINKERNIFLNDYINFWKWQALNFIALFKEEPFLITYKNKIDYKDFDKDDFANVYFICNEVSKDEILTTYNEYINHIN